MRILFMGTPDFAVPSLKALIENQFEVCAVFTQPDKPKGRGHKLQAPPVKELAMQHEIPVYQPATLRNEETASLIRDLHPDVIVVVAYGKLLPKTVLDIPKHGCINVHGSLLPKYRGAAPIQWAVINGEKTTGVTTMYMAEGLDTGDMILKAETPIGENETAGELFDRLKETGAGLLIDTLHQVQQGTVQSVPQNDDEATLAPMLNKQDGRINWAKPAQAVLNQIRGMNPWPAAYTSLENKKIKVFDAKVIDFTGEPGNIETIDGALAVFCGEKALLLTEIQPENKKRMSGWSFLLGNPVAKGTKLL